MFACPAAGTSDITSKLQPKVVVGQQLIRAFNRHTLQPMVVINKEEAKRRFAERLNALLDEQNVANRGRPAYLARTFKNQFSLEAARKWLDAEAIPETATLAMMCTYFGWSVDYLLTGFGSKYIPKDDPLAQRFIHALQNANPKDRAYLERTLEMVLDNPPDPAPPDRTKPSPTPAPKSRRN